MYQNNYTYYTESFLYIILPGYTNHSKTSYMSAMFAPGKCTILHDAFNTFPVWGLIIHKDNNQKTLISLRRVYSICFIA